MKQTPEQVYFGLQDDFLILKKKGSIMFDLGNITIVVKQRDVVGNIMQEWVEGWLKENGIEYAPNDNTQMPPDIYLDPDDKTHNLLEIKAFNYDASPAFDIADPASYLEELVRHPYMLDAKYLIFGYRMDENGVVTIQDMWLKSVWEITAPTKQSFAMAVGGNAKKMRPTKWYNRSKRATAIYASKEHFLSAFVELLFVQHHDVSQDAKSRIIESYKQHYGVTLDIPWWSSIRGQYFK